MQEIEIEIEELITLIAGVIALIGLLSTIFALSDGDYTDSYYNLKEASYISSVLSENKEVKLARNLPQGTNVEGIKNHKIKASFEDTSLKELYTFKSPQLTLSQQKLTIKS